MTWETLGGRALDAVVWPGSVTIIGLYAVRKLRPNLAALIDRTKKWGKDGFDASPQKNGEQQIQKNDFQKTLTQTYRAEEELRKIEMPLLTNREEEIKKHFEKAPEPERLKVLTSLLAHSLFALEFERLYNIIYGSQLAALQSLNPIRLVHPNALLPFYDAVKANLPNYPFESWLRFLESQKLIVSTNGNIEISTYGREFLKYLIHQGYSFNRPL